MSISTDSNGRSSRHQGCGSCRCQCRPQVETVVYWNMHEYMHVIMSGRNAMIVDLTFSGLGLRFQVAAVLIAKKFQDLERAYYHY
jgi:hypothetical protein